MVGRAVETIVWSSAARNMPSSSAPMMTSTLRRGKSRVGVGTGTVVLIVGPCVTSRSLPHHTTPVGLGSECGCRNLIQAVQPGIRRQGLDEVGHGAFSQLAAQTLG